MSKKFPILFLALACLTTYFSDALSQSGTDTHPYTDGFDGVARVIQTGGLCPYGGCYGEVTIKRDGDYTLAQGYGPLATVLRKDHLSQAEIAELIKLIRGTDFQKVKLRRLKGTCPTAYDGAEVIYVFDLPTGVEIISSCAYTLDDAWPLFKYTSELVSRIYSLGPNQSQKALTPGYAQ